MNYASLMQKIKLDKIIQYKSNNQLTTMKRIVLCFLAAIAAVSCYDDTVLMEKVDEIAGIVITFDERLKQLETDLADVQTDLDAVKILTEALQGGLYIKSLKPLADGSGHVITFSDDRTIIFNNSAEGSDGNIPEFVVSVMTVDGVMVWAVNGTPLKNDDKYVEVYAEAPQFRINEQSKTLEVSYDGCKTWLEVGNLNLNGAQGGIASAIFSDVAVDEENGKVTITLTEDGSKIVLPLETEFELIIDDVVFFDSRTVTIPYRVKGANDKTVVDVYGSRNAVVEDGKITIGSVTEGMQILVFADNREGKTSIKKVRFEGLSCSVTLVSSLFPAEGGILNINGAANIPFDVVIPEDAPWITHVETKAESFTLVFNLAENPGRDRSVAISLVRKSTGLEFMTFNIHQKGVTPRIGEFVMEYVKLIDIWKSNVGTVNYITGIGANGDEYDVENAHYVPDETTITLGDFVYNLADAVELASRSYLLLRGYDGNNTDTYGRNLPIPRLEKAYTLNDELPETHSYAWGGYPYAEISNGGCFRMMTDEGEFELVKVDVLDDYSHRHTNYPLRYGFLSNFCSYVGGQLAGYGGTCCVKRIMMAYAYFFKYMLDNDIQTATDIPDSEMFPAPLFSYVLTPGGSGTDTDPYIIDSAEDMLEMNDKILSGETTYFKMTADVDMSGIEVFAPINNMSPYASRVFFDGNGHKICNYQQENGIFYVLCGTFQNVVFENCEVTGTSAYRGLIAHYLGYDSGETAHGTHVKNIVFRDCRVSGANATGLLSGQTYGCVVENVFMEDCHITTTGRRSGFLAGIVNGDSEFKNCYVKGGSTSGGLQQVGGLVGQNSAKRLTVTNCGVSADISGNRAMGGILAFAQGPEGFTAIENCLVWSKSIKCVQSSNNVYSSGAILGYTTQDRVTLKNCYRRSDFEFEDVAPGMGVLHDSDDIENGCLSSTAVDPDNYFYCAAWHGNAAAPGKTASQAAKDLGWDEALWDLSGDEPVLK